jgi:hypothetical protein
MWGVDASSYPSVGEVNRSTGFWFGERGVGDQASDGGIGSFFTGLPGCDFVERNKRIARGVGRGRRTRKDTAVCAKYIAEGINGDNYSHDYVAGSDDSNPLSSWPRIIPARRFTDGTTPTNADTAGVGVSAGCRLTCQSACIGARSWVVGSGYVEYDRCANDGHDSGRQLKAPLVIDAPLDDALGSRQTENAVPT